VRRPDDASTLWLGACECSCDADSQFTCELQPGCCNQDADCGDFAYAPCVNNVCKMPVLDACWSNAECDQGEICVGASVCPCGYDCDAPDTPGHCTVI
jgi:hypothetical protein